MDRRTLITAAAATVVLPLRALSAAGPDGPLRMRDLYEKTLDFSELALSLEGERIAMTGFMAPPLKAESEFFVLTKRPMAVCPFCESSADWPADILAIYTKRTVDPVPFNVKIETSGVLELGTYRDPDLGFVSRVRLRNATFRRA